MRILTMLAIGLGAASVALAAPAYTAKVTGGALRGKALGEGALFAGVPYARPPVGELRWQAPQPVMPWPGERDATRPGAPAMQPDMGWNRTHRQGQSEDCLYLNVLTPEWPATKRWPVIVYIHGGANVGGAGWDHLLEHVTLQQRGVVLVSLNYRLGVFGFLAHPALTAESPHGASGNYALLDQIAALRWVRDNIAAFGGDPAKVTLMGQSAGAQDIGLLMAAPQARGLFHGAILESGPVTAIGMIRFAPLAEAERAGAAFFGQRSLADMRAMSAEELLAAATSARPAGGPSIDGWVLTELPNETFARGGAAPVPVLLGSNAREYPFGGGEPELRAQIGEVFGLLATRARKLYGLEEGQALPPADPVLGSVGDQFISDLIFRVPTELVALWQSAAGQKVWRYQFSRTPIGKDAEGAGHSMELPYVFGEMVPNGLGDDYNAADRALSATMQRYWVNFATSGNPNGEGLPLWPAYDGEKRAYVEFEEAGVRVAAGLRREIVDLSLERLATKRE